jgi:hypothetical protein
MRVTFRWLFTVVVCAVPVAAPAAAPVPAAPAKADNPIAAVRKALDEVGDMNYQARSLQDVIADLKEKSKVPIILDSSLANFGLDITQPTVSVNLKQVKLEKALEKVLEPYNLKFGIIGEGLYISTEEGVTIKQLRQRVSIDCDGTELATALKQLAADTGANIVVAPNIGDRAKKAVSLKLDKVPVETAVRLLAEVADLRCVRMENVLWVTTPEKAKVLREDGSGPTSASPVNPVFPFGPNGNVVPGGFGGGVQVLPAVPAVDVPAPAPAQPAPAPEKK